MPSTSTAAVSPGPVRSYYTANGDTATVVGLLKAQFPALRVNFATGSKVLVLTATLAQQADALAYLARVDPVGPAAPGAAPSIPAALVRSVYPLNADPAGLVGLLKAQFPNLKVVAAPDAKALTVTAPAAQQADIATFLAKVDPAPTNPAPAATPRA